MSLKIGSALLFIIGIIFMAPTLCTHKKWNLVYPTAHKDPTFDIIHGVKIYDPYRWLEDQATEATKQWVTQQQAITANFFKDCIGRDKIKTRISNLINFKRHSLPWQQAEYYFYWLNEGLQNQSVLYRTKDLTQTPDIVLDPNKLSTDGTIAIDTVGISQDGKLLAYAAATNGSDWTEIKILNIDSKTLYPETLVDSKFSTLSWKKDSSGVYYNRFTKDQNEKASIFFHTLGTSQSEDILIYENTSAEEFSRIFVTDDGVYLLLFTSIGCNPKNNISFKKIESNSTSFTPIFEGFTAEYNFAGNIGSIFYFVTDHLAPHKKIIAIDVEKLDEAPRVVIATKKEILDSAEIINNFLVCTYLKDASSVIEIHDLDGTLINVIDLPSIGSAECSGNSKEKSELFISFTSFLHPGVIFSYDFKTHSLNPIWQATLTFNPNDFVIKQEFYPSLDGTKVPMFIVHKKNITLNGNNPTLLYGYGGFSQSLTPFFSGSMLHWLELGGIYAIANIRGGAEYGPSWHEQAICENKQVSFDDFIAGAQHLIKQNYTNPKKLAIRGGSNGGLLVGVCMQQKPELFGAVVSQVPVTDMMRFHKFTAGKYWVTDYGSIENEKEFNAMYAYSPLHTVKENQSYPPLLVTSADTDDRVVPMHSKKWVATLQAASKGENLILLRYETEAGHGSGKPLTKQIDEVTDVLAFLTKIFEINIG